MSDPAKSSESISGQPAHFAPVGASKIRAFLIKAIIGGIIAGGIVTSVGSALAKRFFHPKMTLSSHTVDFGELLDGKPASRELTIRNDGFRPLEIYNIRASCGCTQAVTDATYLGRGEETKLRLTLTGRADPVETRVSITTNDPRNPTETIELSARSAIRVSVSPAYLDFASKWPQVLPASKQLVLNFPDQELYSKTDVVGAVIDSPYFATVIKRDETTGTYAVAVTVSESTPGGTTHATLRISDAKGQFAFTVPINVERPSSRWLSPGLVILGASRNGITVPTSVDCLIKHRVPESSPTDLRMAFDSALERLVDARIIESTMDNAGTLLRLSFKADARGQLQAKTAKRGHLLLSSESGGAGDQETFSIPVLVLPPVLNLQGKTNEVTSRGPDS
ncbi:MAG: DUF1573 domain-containing protein [Planctomycetaceae bacterium]